MDRLDNLLHFHQTALSMRSTRQELLASNIANADTPDYKARDVDFNSALQTALENSRQTDQQLPMAKTSAMHLNAGVSTAPVNDDTLVKYRVPLQPSADGNTVDMDVERANFADNTLRYQASLRFVNSKFSGLMTAMRSN